MKIKLILPFLILILSCIEEREPEAAVHFNEELKVWPIKDTYSLGDTIWIGSSGPSFYEDQIAEIKIGKNETQIKYYLSITDFSLSKPAKFKIHSDLIIDTTDIVNTYNHVVTNVDELEINYGCSINSSASQYAFGIILTKKGLYSLLPNSSSNYGLSEGEPGSTACPFFLNSYEPFGGTKRTELTFYFDQNINKQLIDEIQNLDSKSRNFLTRLADSKSSYFFKVK